MYNNSQDLPQLGRVDTLEKNPGFVDPHKLTNENPPPSTSAGPSPVSSASPAPRKEIHFVNANQFEIKEVKVEDMQHQQVN